MKHHTEATENFHDRKWQYHNTVVYFANATGSHTKLELGDNDRLHKSTLKCQNQEITTYERNLEISGTVLSVIGIAYLHFMNA